MSFWQFCSFACGFPRNPLKKPERTVSPKTQQSTQLHWKATLAFPRGFLEQPSAPAGSLPGSSGGGSRSLPLPAAQGCGLRTNRCLKQRLCPNILITGGPYAFCRSFLAGSREEEVGRIKSPGLFNCSFCMQRNKEKMWGASEGEMAMPLLSKASQGTLGPYAEAECRKGAQGRGTSCVPSTLQAAKPFPHVHPKSTASQKVSLMSPAYCVSCSKLHRYK